MKKISAFLLSAVMLFTLSACNIDNGGSSGMESTDTQNYSSKISDESSEVTKSETLSSAVVSEPAQIDVPDNFVLIKGGTFEMGSPETETWRSDDETQHIVTVSDFYMSIYELTQAEYRDITGSSPSNFSGDELPVENISWLEAVRYCNALSIEDELTPAYTIDETGVTWDRTANGYRLPTEAEWEYACRAGTTTPFNTENSISAEEANYYGHYPYEIEDNYFTQENLSTKPGQYRQTTVAVNSFSPNKWGLYNMHGNVGEWVWDRYGEYGMNAQTDPVGAESGTLRVYRGAVGTISRRICGVRTAQRLTKIRAALI